MVEKLDKKDIKILWELFQNSRTPLSAIAKKVKIPKQTVKYRIDQLISRGVLNKTFTIVDMSKFNFLFYEVFVKLQNIPKEKEINALEQLKKHPYLGWLVTLEGRFSFHCAAFVRKPYQFSEVYSQIKSLFHPYIKELALNVTIDGKQFDYPFFKEIRQTVMETKTSKEDDDVPKLNKTQKQLLNLLANNSRIPTIELARKLGTTEKTVRSNIKQLEREKIILNHTCQLHPGKAGYFFHMITIRLNRPSKKLIEYLKTIPEIFYMVKSEGFCDLKTEFYVKEESRIYEIQREIHEKFGEYISETDVMHITKEYLVRYFTDA